MTQIQNLRLVGVRRINLHKNSLQNSPGVERQLSEVDDTAKCVHSVAKFPL